MLTTDPNDNNDNPDIPMGEGVFIQAIVEDLSAEKDENTALRKALLALVYLTSDDVSLATSAFVEWILMRFPPISERFHNHRQRFIRNEHIMRARSNNKVELLVREDLLHD
ncbi:MAG: hypothetical protein CL878_13670 [Dehalococcoidia bacterium]|nr:hypothetical protein [Dehalococcoidia bacterium]